MPIPEAISGALVKGGIEHGVEAAKSLLQKLCGPAAEEFGAMLQDRTRVYRLKNQLRMLGKVQTMLDNAGTGVHSVPLRTLLPFLEGAALEDDEDLSDKWAGLLATAASSNESGLMHPSFPRILSEMSPRDAFVLDRLYQLGTPINWIAFRKQLTVELETQEDSIHQAYGNLHRLGLCNVTSSGFGVVTTPVNSSVIKLTKFGEFFLNAANGPKFRADTETSA